MCKAVPRQVNYSRLIIVQKDIELREGMNVKVNWQGKKVSAEILALNDIELKCNATCSCELLLCLPRGLLVQIQSPISHILSVS